MTVALLHLILCWDFPGWLPGRLVLPVGVRGEDVDGGEEVEAGFDDHEDEDDGGPVGDAARQVDEGADQQEDLQEQEENHVDLQPKTSWRINGQQFGRCSEL